MLGHRMVLSSGGWKLVMSKWWVTRYVFMLILNDPYELDCYWRHYRNWSLRWIGSGSEQWRTRWFAFRLRCNGHRGVFYDGCSWWNDNSVPGFGFICRLFFGAIRVSTKIWGTDSLCHPMARPRSRLCPWLQLLVFICNHSPHRNYRSGHRHFILGHQNQSGSVDHGFLGCYYFYQLVSSNTRCLRAIHFY